MNVEIEKPEVYERCRVCPLPQSVFPLLLNVRLKTIIHCNPLYTVHPCPASPNGERKQPPERLISLTVGAHTYTAGENGVVRCPVE